jgi:hypothetical protein
VLDRTSLALTAVFLLGASFFFWRATFAEPLALHGGANSQYNQLADALLHFHLWVVHIPEGVLGAGNPYNPAQRPPFLYRYSDYALYGHYLYITWGVAPVLVLLVPLHLLGFEPSASVISTPFAIVGLGFALATLRAIIRRIGRVSLWLCILAGLTLTFASVIPFILRFPLVYHEEIAAGYCFTSAAVWVATSAVVERRASLKRLAFMSLCMGLATGTRPPLGVTALMLLPVYIVLRATRPRRGLLLTLGVPLGVCLLLLFAYNQARFHSPLQYGAIYQINGLEAFNGRFGEISYLGPGLWAYLIAPPRLNVLFPFFVINYPEVSYPLTLPAHYGLSEETGGLLTMAPISIFLVGLPWLWRRRPALLGSLGSLLLVMAIAGMVCMAFVAFEIYIATERYEADWMTLLLLGALTVWLVLCSTMQGRGRRLVRVGGALLAVWSCATGLAISYQEIEKDPGTWHTLINLGAPLSTAIARIAGHPVVAEVYSRGVLSAPPEYNNLGSERTGFWLAASDRADLTIVSPDNRTDALLADTVAGPALGGRGFLELRVDGPGRASHTYAVPAGTRARVPIQLERGVNQLVLSPVVSQASPEPEGEPPTLMTFNNFALASG